MELTAKKGTRAWVMLIMASVLGFAVMTFTVTPMSLFVVPITTDLELARSAYTLTQTFQYIGIILSSFMFGSVSKKFGLRGTIAVGALLQATGFFILSRSSVLPAFYAGGFTMGFASGFCAVSAASTLVNTWFAKRSGFMVGIVFTMTSLGGIFWNPTIGSFIANYGWRNSFMICAAIILGISILMAILVRNKPSDVGQEALWQAEADAEKATSKTPEVRGLMFPEAIKTPKLKLLLLMIFLCGLTIPPSVATIPAYLNDLGLDVAVLWGLANSVTLAVNTVSKIPLSGLADKKGVRYMITIALGAYIIGIICMVFASPTNTFFVFMAAGFMGFAVLMTSVPMPIMIREFFGNKDFAKIMGIVFAVFSIGQAIATPSMNFVYDTLGSYKYVYYVLLPVGIIIFVIGWMASSKNPKHLIIKGEPGSN